MTVDHHYFEDGVEVFPCRCGVTHRGEYVTNDFARHECFHKRPLHILPEVGLICGECGQTFAVEQDTKSAPTSDRDVGSSETAA